MSQIETTSAIEKYGERCEDRVDVIHDDQRTAIVVADGAGIGSGNVAADSVVRAVKSNYKTLHSANDWANFLVQTDKQIGPGESTAVVVLDKGIP